MSSFWRRVAVAAAVMTAVAACETRVPEQAFSWAPQTPAGSGDRNVRGRCVAPSPGGMAGPLVQRGSPDMPAGMMDRRKRK